MGAILSWIPSYKDKTRVRKLKDWFGFEEAQNQARSAGVKINFTHYILLLLCSALVGVAISVWLGNVLFIAVGAIWGYFIPRMVFSMIKYKRRKEILTDLPSNCGLLKSNLPEGESLQRALQLSLPLMGGVTKPVFQKLYEQLKIGMSVNLALKQAANTIKFNKFYDLCEKLNTGNTDGYHLQAMDSIQESIDAIADDVQHLQEIDIQNRKKRSTVYVIVGGAWFIALAMRFMESEMNSGFQVIPSMDTPIGKIFVATMALASVFTFAVREKYLKLNLDDL